MRTSGMTAMHAPGSVDALPSPNDRVDMLERRLSDGYERIEQALAIGEDVTRWEDFWIDLLHQYESALAPFDIAA